LKRLFDSSNNTCPQGVSSSTRGGGPGRYTIELARKGYKVVLLDLAPANLRFAKALVRKANLGGRVEHFVEGSVEDLSQFDDQTFDALLCLGGTLSHLIKGEARRRAIEELVEEVMLELEPDAVWVDVLDLERKEPVELNATVVAELLGELGACGRVDGRRRSRAGCASESSRCRDCRSHYESILCPNSRHDLRALFM